MADSKLTGLGEGTTIDKDSDYIYYVDSSDTTMSASGTSKRIKPKHIPISDATQTALDAKEGTISAGTTSQYYRGDKSWQTLNKSAVGLGSVDNTADADKPVSTATQTALDLKQDSSTALTIGETSSTAYRGDRGKTAYDHSQSTGNPHGTAISDITGLQAGIDAGKLEYIVVACSDETTALTTGTAKVTFRMPFAMTLTAVRASLSTAQSSGSILTVDINEAGTSILSTKLTIDNSEKTSVTAATAAVISDTALADDAEITIDIDQVGTTPTGLKVTLIGTR